MIYPIHARADIGALTPESIMEKANRLFDQGKTLIFVSMDRRVNWLLAVADELKENAIEVISKLKSMGLQEVMITGDNERPAKAIARAKVKNEV